MSKRPNAFGFFDATGWVLFDAFVLNHPSPSTSSSLVAPYQGVVVPARAACSHSASLGNRTRRPDLRDAHAVKAVASANVTRTTGSSSFCGKPGLRQVNSFF